MYFLYSFDKKIYKDSLLYDQKKIKVINVYIYTLYLISHHQEKIPAKTGHVSWKDTITKCCYIQNYSVTLLKSQVSVSSSDESVSNKTSWLKSDWIDLQMISNNFIFIENSGCTLSYNVL